MQFTYNNSGLTTSGQTATVVRGSQIDTDQFAKLINENMRTLDIATIKGVFSAMEKVLTDELAKGNNVSIEGLVSFKQTIKGTFDNTVPKSDNVRFKAIFSQAFVKQARAKISFQQTQTVPKTPIIKNAVNSLNISNLDQSTNIITITGNNLTSNASPIDKDAELGIKLTNTALNTVHSPSSYALIQPSQLIALFSSEIYTKSKPHYVEHELSDTARFTTNGEKRTGTGPRIRTPVMATITAEASTIPIFYFKEITASEGFVLTPPLEFGGIYENLPAAPYTEIYEFYISIMPVGQIQTTNPTATLFTVSMHDTSLTVIGTGTFTVSDIRTAPVEVTLTAALPSASETSNLTGFTLTETIRTGNAGEESILTVLQQYSKKAFINGIFEKMKVTLDVA